LRASDLDAEADAEVAPILVNGLPLRFSREDKFAAASATLIVDVSSGEGVSIACAASPARSFVNGILLERITSR
jgi:hypothetical protein